MTIVPLGETAVLVSVDEGPPSERGDILQRLVARLRHRPLPGVYDFVPAFHSLAVHFDPLAVGGKDPHHALSAWISAAAEEPMALSASPSSATLELPLCVSQAFSPDLPWVATRSGLSVDEVVAQFLGSPYTVAAVGFAPGFPYLAGLPPCLHTPRRATPRPAVPAGSVGIGGFNTGVYPQSTSGGWNLIGRTPVRLFHPELPAPARLSVGMRVTFVLIDEVEFQRRWDEEWS